MVIDGTGSGATDDEVVGNYIGLDMAGTTVLSTAGFYGIIVYTPGNTIGGTTAAARNVISSSSDAGINLSGSLATGNLVVGDYIGTNASGTAALIDIDHYQGIAEGSGSQGNTIGGTVAGDGNLVVLQGAATYAIVATSDSLVAGNLIDSNPTGTAAIGQTFGGITINGSNNTLGGTVASARNILPTDGIWVQGAASGNLVEGNISGLDITGTIKLSGNSGIEVDGPNNTIGGTVAGSANVLAGLAAGGETGELELFGSTSTGNLVEGNLIGTDITGTVSIRTGRYGLIIGEGATNDTVGGTTSAARNVIASSGYGLLIDSNSPGNLVEGNYIGTDITGTQSLSNSVGILVASGSNTIGGTSAGAANIISGNAGSPGDPDNGYGLWLTGSAATSNLVEGNLIGLDVTGEHILGNTTNAGIFIDGAPNNTIGGTTPSAANVISGNYRGLFITDEGLATPATGNVVEGNLIGTDATGTVALGNVNQGILITLATSNTFGGTASGAGNVISGNLEGGVDDDAGGNLYEGNLIGTNAAGTAALPNISGGIGVSGPGATIGGTTAGAGNVISGNTGDGVDLVSSGAGDLVAGNRIGTNAAGTDALENTGDGVYLIQISGATIGGTVPAAVNLISGNANGVEINDSSLDLVQGNLIGTDTTGTLALGNTGAGMLVDAGSSSNTIGGVTATPGTGAGNLISGNNATNAAGIDITGTDTSNNAIEGNVIGLTSGGAALGNYYGVEIDSAASSNTIGGLTSAPGTGAGNVISGNAQSGIQFTATAGNNTLIEGNLIGLAADGTTRRGNSAGVFINWGFNTQIGGTDVRARNVISANANGILLSTSGSDMSTLIEGNYIGTDVTGTLAKGNSTGIDVGSSPGTVIGGTVAGAGNVISGNSTGVFISGTSHPVIGGTYNSIVQGNLIGLNAAGTSALGNATGVGVGNASNAIGGSSPGAGNVISGNTGDGVYISGASASGNLIAGNFIGTDVSGTHALGNGGGVYTDFLSSNTTIGGATAAARNVISGNAGSGVDLFGTGDVVQANYIGVDVTGNAPLGNLGNGIVSERHTVTIGGPSTAPGVAPGNVIAGNLGGAGIWFYQAGTVTSTVQGNIIGLAADGSTAIGSEPYGIDVLDTQNVTIGGLVAADRNVISANSQFGIYLYGASTSGTVVEGNYIGTDVTGTVALANATGVEIDTSASGNTIGGTAAGALNVISGNSSIGVDVSGSGTASNLIVGNLIGTDVTGTVADPNGTGVDINSGSSDNTIGGTAAGARDVISGNSGDGLLIQTTTSSGNVVEGDFIGTDMTGDAALGNVNGILLFASGNTIGGTVAGAGNIIAGNDGTGYVFNGSQILIAGNPGLASDNNLIAGNSIGLDANGQALAGATGGGIVFDELTAGETTGNTIGGTTAGARNVISGNLGGIDLAGDNGNLVEGNYIGTDPTGTIAIGNEGYDDVALDQGVSNDTIGGTTAGARNIISGDNFPRGGAGLGIDMATDCVVEGNFIGTDVTGTQALPNYKGVDFGEASNSNDTIGGATATPGTGAGNLIAGNGNGIDFFGESGLVVIEGNAIGQVALPGGGTSPGNGIDGIDVISSSSSILIGGTSPLDENVISGNTSDGIEINASSAVLVEGNDIGTDITGTAAVANGYDGVEIDTGASANTIGGTTAAARNIISANLIAGVEIDGANDNVVEGDFIGTDVTGTIALANGADGSYSGGIDVVNSASANTIGGLTALPGTGAGNLISGNIGAGVSLYGAGPNNLVAGNLIGTDVTGSVALGNDYALGAQVGGTGVVVNYSPDTIVGEPGGGNVIGGNGLGTVNGANVNLYYSTGSVVQSNYIGTDITGTVALSTTTYYGVSLAYGSYTVGGITPTPGTGLGNVISGNGIYGITYRGYTVGDTVGIEGNIVGADPTGEHAVPNLDGGIGLYFVSLVTIGGTAAGAGNLISGNDDYGSGGNIYLSGASNNVVEGNLIGTDMTGKAPVNASGVLNGSGVAVVDGSSDNTIGGTTAAARNIISGNAYSGVYIGVYGAYGSISSSNVVEGNYIGTDKTGTAALANAYDGVELGTGASGNTIGGTTASARNIISGNTRSGVEITSTGATGNAVTGNYIGTDNTGTVAIGNGTGVEIDTSASGNTIGGVTSTPGTGAGNVISGNTDNGVVIDGTGLPAETYLYLKADGNPDNSAINPNGVYVGNATLLLGGVTYGTGVTGQAFQFNDTAGERVVVNDPANYLAVDAVTLSAWINLSSLPGSTPYVIASRAYSATSENYGIYVNSAGELVFEWYSAGAFHTETSSGADLGSRLGVFQQVAVVTDGSTVTFYVNGVAVSSAAMPDPLDDSASGDLEIGGLSQGPNLFNGLIDEISVTLDPLPADVIARIYANAGQGTDLGGSGTQDTTITGNLIGTNFAGTSAVPNGGNGVEIDDAFNNTIGGNTAGAGNVVSGNTNDGVEINGAGATGNVVAGNLIGTDVTGTVAMGNLADGVLLYEGASDNVIGGTTASARNIISANADSGVLIYGGNDNLVEGNYIGTDKTGSVGLGNNQGSGTNGFEFGGISLYIGSSGNTIGGLTATPGTGVGNVISGNTFAGVVLNYAGSNNLIAGNLIGTDATGTVALGNLYDAAVNYGGAGVGVLNSGSTIVGEPGGRNVISANGPGTVGGTNVYMTYSSGSVIQSNYIGTDITGTVALSTSTLNGVEVQYGSYTIGGLTPTPGTGLGNVISGNSIGIYYAGYTASDAVLIEGNIIGADATGEHELPNRNGGVILDQVSLVTIGGTAAGAGNLISGDNRPGSEGDIFLDDSTDNAVEGNLIGTDITGGASLPALPGDGNGIGVLISNGSTDNTIGGTTAAARNIISGIDGPGVYITDPTTSANVVLGNLHRYQSGGHRRPRQRRRWRRDRERRREQHDRRHGRRRRQRDLGQHDQRRGDLGHGYDRATSSRATTSAPTLTGTGAIANGTGVEIDTGASGNTIGGTAAAARNIISANDGSGVEIDVANDNLVEGNYVGTDKTGTIGLGNDRILENIASGGISLDGGAAGNTIGGLTATPGTGAGNLISGNTLAGVLLNYAGSDNLVAGNLIGTDVTGTVALGNLFDTPAFYGGYGVDLNYSPDNTVGEPGGRNVISGNGPGGPGTTNTANVVVYYSSGSAVQSNFIGTDITGTVAISNDTYNMYVGGGSSITIGGLTPTPGTGLGNVISGNNAEFGLGIAGVTGPVVVEGNIIGADATGEHELPNAVSGVYLSQASGVTIGGAAAGAGNLISGDNRYGNEGNIYLEQSSNNAIEGNKIGTDITGSARLPALPGDVYGTGVIIADGSTDNTIGGTTPSARNIISGIDGPGVYIGAAFVPGSVSSGNVVLGNYIGIDAAGTTALANDGDGVEIATGAADNTIGGTTAGAGNVISGNTTNGVEISGTGTSGNVVEGDYIGTDFTGTVAIANATGVEIDTGTSGNTIGSIAPGAGNTIAYNTGDGVQVVGNGTTGNSIRGNSIFANGVLGIELGTSGVPSTNILGGSTSGPNDQQNYPVLTIVSYTPGTGTTIAGNINTTPNTTVFIDLYTDTVEGQGGYGQGQTYLGSVTVTTTGDGNTSFTYLSTSLPRNSIVSATATDPGSTSEFSLDQAEDTPRSSRWSRGRARRALPQPPSTKRRRSTSTAPVRTAPTATH